MAKQLTTKELYKRWSQDRDWLQYTFLGQVIKCKPEDMELGRYLDIVFGVSERDIDFYICNKDIRLYGAIWYDNLRLRDVRRRAIENFKVGDNACIRIDSRESLVCIESKWGCIDVPRERWFKEYSHAFTRLKPTS